MDVHDVGDEVPVESSYTLDGAPHDPSGGVTLRVRKPDGTEADVAVANPEVGVFRGLVAVDAPGQWWWRFAAAGDVVDVRQGSFLARMRAVVG